jgi:hypothetical protein
MMCHHPDIVPRDDNMFDVVSGDFAAGPFPTIAFALQVARGNRPEPAPAARSRHFKMILEVHRNA